MTGVVDSFLSHHCFHQLPAGPVRGRLNLMFLPDFHHRAANGIDLCRCAAQHILQHGGMVGGCFAGNVFCCGDGVWKRQWNVFRLCHLRGFLCQRLHHFACRGKLEQSSIGDAQDRGQRIDGGVDDQFSPDERLRIFHNIHVEICRPQRLFDRTEGLMPLNGDAPLSALSYQTRVPAGWRRWWSRPGQRGSSPGCARASRGCRVRFGA